MQSIFAASFSTSLLSVFLIAGKNWMIRILGATYHYRLWFCLFIPWIIVWIPWYLLPINIFTLAKPIHFILSNPLIPVDKLFFTLTNSMSGHTIPFFIFSMWATGVLLGLCYLMLQHIRFILFLKKNARPLSSDETKQLTPFLPVIDKILVTRGITSPMLCHILHPTIYLPAAFFDYYDQTEKNYIIEHELMHYKRGDLFANGLMLILTLLNWFNPLSFMAYAYFRNAQEIACDAMVINQFSLSARKVYGYALLKTVMHATRCNSKLQCGWNLKPQLKERTRLLALHRSRPLKTVLGLLALLVTIFTALAASSLENRDSLLIYSMLSAGPSDWAIKLFNSTQTPLHFSVLESGHRIANGILACGDDQGELVAIHDLRSVAVLIKNKMDHLILNVILTHDKKKGCFSTALISLDDHYCMGTTNFSKQSILMFNLSRR